MDERKAQGARGQRGEHGQRPRPGGRGGRGRFLGRPRGRDDDPEADPKEQRSGRDLKGKCRFDQMDHQRGPRGERQQGSFRRGLRCRPAWREEDETRERRHQSASQAGLHAEAQITRPEPRHEPADDQDSHQAAERRTFPLRPEIQRPEGEEDACGQDQQERTRAGRAERKPRVPKQIVKALFQTLLRVDPRPRARQHALQRLRAEADRRPHARRQVGVAVGKKERCLREEQPRRAGPEAGAKGIRSLAHRDRRGEALQHRQPRQRGERTARDAERPEENHRAHRGETTPPQHAPTRPERRRGHDQHDHSGEQGQQGAAAFREQDRGHLEQQDRHVNTGGKKPPAPRRAQRLVKPHERERDDHPEMGRQGNLMARERNRAATFFQNALIEVQGVEAAALGDGEKGERDRGQNERGGEALPLGRRTEVPGDRPEEHQPGEKAHQPLAVRREAQDAQHRIDRENSRDQMGQRQQPDGHPQDDHERRGGRAFRGRSGLDAPNHPGRGQHRREEPKAGHLERLERRDPVRIVSQRHEHHRREPAGLHQSAADLMQPGKRACRDGR